MSTETEKKGAARNQPFVYYPRIGYRSARASSTGRSLNFPKLCAFPLGFPINHPQFPQASFPGHNVRALAEGSSIGEPLLEAQKDELLTLPQTIYFYEPSQRPLRSFLDTFKRFLA